MSSADVSQPKKLRKKNPLSSGTLPLATVEENLGFYHTLVSKLDANSRIPLYKQISTIFENAIEAGSLKPGERLPSERRLTGVLGVSRCTLRGALTELIERKYLATAKGMGNFVLEPPSTRKLYFISVERHHLDFWTFSPTHYKWLEGGSKMNDADILYRYVDSTEELHNILKNPPEACNGLILFRPTPEWTHYLSQLDDSIFENSPVPIVLIGRSVKKRGLNTVSLNYAEGARLATQRLIDLGHRNIGFIGAAPKDHFYHLPYFKGYQAALENTGLPILEENYCLLSNPTNHGALTKEAFDTLKRFLERRKFTGLVVSILNKPVEKLLQQLGIVVPETLSAVSLIEQHLVDTLTLRWTGVQMASTDLVAQGVTVLSEVCRGIRKNGYFEEIPMLPLNGGTCKSMAGEEVAPPLLDHP